MQEYKFTASTYKGSFPHRRPGDQLDYALKCMIIKHRCHGAIKFLNHKNKGKEVSYSCGVEVYRTVLLKYNIHVSIKML